MIRTEVVADLAQVDPHQWGALLARCPDSTVFQSRAWIGSWWTAFAQPGMHIHSIAVYDGLELVGLAPLYMTSRRVMGLRLAELRFLGEGRSDYNLFSVRDGAPEIMHRLIEALRRELYSNVAIVLTEVPQFSSLGLCLSAQCTQRTPRLAGLRKVSTTPCPRVRLGGNSTGVSTILRKDSLRRHFKALSRIGPIGARHHTVPTEIRKLLPELYRQHVARWSKTDFPSLFLADDNRRFYELLTESLGSDGSIVMTELRAGEQLAALHFGLRSRDELIWYKPTFDISLARQGPGEVLLKTLVEYAYSEGYSALDFSRGDERFKSRFATSVDYNATYEWIPQHPPRLCLEVARRLSRAFRGRRHSPDSEDAEAPLANTHTSNARLLLVDLPAAVANIVVTRLADAGLHADVAFGEGTTDRSYQLDTGDAHELPCEPAAAFRKLLALDSLRHYAMVVPFAEATLSLLGSMPTSHALRPRVLAPGTLALDNANRDLLALLDQLRLPMTLTLVDASLLNAPGRSGLWIVQCLCAHGRLAWYRVLPGTRGPHGWAAWSVPQCAKRVLERLQWHGFATLTFDVAADGHVTMKGVAPILVPYETDADCLARFLVSAWAMIGLRRVSPQPDEFTAG